MYIAELRGKLSRDQENKEDLLTSNVFSFLKYAPRDIFLYEYINHLGIPVTKNGAHEAKFLFWTTYDDLTEPDVVILIGNYYLLFEAKLFSGFGEETEFSAGQLSRELEGGLSEAKNNNKDFRLIAITADHYQPPGLFRNLPNNFQNLLLWTSWQDFAFFVSSILETRPDLPKEAGLFAEDLYNLLDKKCLRKFEGPSALRVKEYPFKPYQYLFFASETARYRGDFIGFQGALKMESHINPVSNVVFYDKNRQFYSFLNDAKERLKTKGGILFYTGGINE